MLSQLPYISIPLLCIMSKHCANLVYSVATFVYWISIVCHAFCNCWLSYFDRQGNLLHIGTKLPYYLCRWIVSKTWQSQVTHMRNVGEVCIQRSQTLCFVAVTVWQLKSQANSNYGLYAIFNMANSFNVQLKAISKSGHYKVSC